MGLIILLSLKTVNNNFTHILEIPFTTLHLSEILNIINSNLQEQSKQIFLATPNPEILLESLKNPQLKSILQKTSFNLPDGYGLIWAHIFLEKTKSIKHKSIIILIGLSSLISFIWHKKSPQKRFNQSITGADTTLDICTIASSSSRTIFLLGNQHGLTNQAAQTAKINLQKNYPNLKIVGAIDSHPQDPKLSHLINQSGAEILFIGFGSPAQEIWLAKNLPHLKSVKLAMGIGGTFDFINKTIPRAPHWMRKTGLEWLYRLYKQPQRLRRIFNATIVFPYTIIRDRLHHPPVNPDKHKI